MEELTLKDYHNKFYFDDLEALINSSENAKDIISLVSLSEEMDAPKFYGETQKAFLQLKNKEYFLITHMLYVLLDQAIHTNTKKEYLCLFKNTVPRLGGILSSYSSNFNPIYLTYLASSYVKNENENIFFEMFKDLVKDIMPKYEDIISKNVNLERLDIFMTIFNSTQNFNLHVNKDFFKRPTNKKLVYDCMSYLSIYVKEYINNENKKRCQKRCQSPP